MLTNKSSYFLQLTKRFKKAATANSVILGILLAIVGGFLDAYTYISRNGVFANAQSGNIVLLGVKAAQGQWTEAFLHIPPIVAFILGVAVTETFKQPRFVSVLPDTSRIVLLLEIVVLIIVGFLPSSVPNMLVTVTISFVAALQVSSFRTLIKWSYNTTMTTGNLRTASQAAYYAIFKRDENAAYQCLRFTAIILSFLSGALLGSISTFTLGAKAVWLASAILFLAFVILNSESQKNL